MEQTIVKAPLTEEEKIEKISYHMKEILQTLGLDSTHPDLIETPTRVAKMYVKECFTGLNPDSFPTLTFSDFTASPKQKNIITIKDIELQSICAHHFLPMVGRATIAYIPNKKIIGLSKIHRIALYWAKRPQLQEFLTKQIAESLLQVLETDSIAVFTNMQHQCLQIRGVNDRSSFMQCSSSHGAFLTCTGVNLEKILA